MPPNMTPATSTRTPASAETHAQPFRVRDLTKVYGSGIAEVRALAGVDLDLYEGELVVLLGPSGSGKTTLLNNLGGLDVPTAGGHFYLLLRPTAAGGEQHTHQPRPRRGFVF